MKPVLLHGPVTKGSLDEVWGEIEFYKKFGANDIVLVINSQGGNGTKALDFIDKIKKSGVNISVKIYHAESAATLIALSFSEREMVKDGKLIIHLGSVEIESCDIAEDGTIPKGYRISAKKFREEMFKLANLPAGSYVDKLLATNRLTLTAEQCFKLGIVQQIIG
ncbi:MAG TPA: ATP-dependent Clp protease proteolytic subunit [Candidatus Paceibacterota bacterium]